MFRFRVSVRVLIGITLLGGVGVAALHEPTPAWESILIIATIAAMSAATLVASLCPAPISSSGLGFAVFGWPVVVLGMGVFTTPRESHAQFTGFLDELIPYISTGLDHEIKRATPIVSPNSYASLSSSIPGLGRYRRISSALLSLALGALGSMMGRMLSTARGHTFHHVSNP